MPAEARTNLKKGERSRKTPQPGDVFAMEFPGNRWLFGRVIANDAISGMGGPSILIYVYDIESTEKALPDRRELRPDRLLVSPMMTNRLPWSRGYFQRVANVPLDDEDVLDQHCFLRGFFGTYHDERGNQLPGPVEPVGEYGLHSFASIDDEISDALGIPPAE